ncbi:MAG: alpha/beta fold hydrolase [Thermocrispum sp.]
MTSQVPAPVEHDDRVAASDGVLLHIEGSGTGPTVLLIHGLGYAAWAGEPLRERLVPAGYRYLTFDNRGTGRSDKPVGPYSIDQLAVDAAAVALTAGAAPVHVIGYSMGGYIALALAEQRPGLVKSLTLIATSAGGSHAVEVPVDTQRAWQQASAESPADFARATMPLSFRPGWSKENPEQFERILRARLENPTPAFAWRAQFEASTRFFSAGIDVRGIHIPSLVVHGTNDRVVPHANGETLARLLPKAGFSSIPGAGHLSWFEEPDRLAEVILNFLADASKGSIRTDREFDV